ncbi:MAG: DUF58 domain-containing protein [Elusimicrobia bacterium]|nr:DUF58 domain-containing protein [Elusimicrobiota bacterium]
MKYLDALALARLKTLRFDLRRHRAEGHLGGRHQGARRGFSQEFAEHRAYATGDELKRLDWKVYARTDRLFVKEYHEEKSLKTYILVDASGSMAYRGRGGESKWDAACRLAMCAAYLVSVQGDAAGLVTFDTKTRTFLPPRRSFEHIELMDKTLAETQPGGETDLSGVLARVAEGLPRRSMLLLVSDLLGDAERVAETVRAFRARRHKVYAMQVLDPEERDFDLDGPLLLESLEDSSSLRVEASLVRASYREAFARQQRLYQAGFHRAGVSHEVFYTDQPWEAPLARLVAGPGA